MALQARFSRRTAAERLSSRSRAEHDACPVAVPIEGQRSVGRVAVVELQELELVGSLHAAVEIVLVDEDAERAFAFRIGCVLPPGTLDLPESVGLKVAEENLVGRVADSLLEVPEPRRDLVGGVLPRGFRAVTDEVGGMREDEGAAVDGGTHEIAYGPTKDSAHSARHTRVFRR